MDDEPGSGADDIGVCGMVGVARRTNSWILLITFYTCGFRINHKKLSSIRTL